MLKLLAFIGALVLIATVDGAISGTVASFWGDRWGWRVNHLVLVLVGINAVWSWVDRGID